MSATNRGKPRVALDFYPTPRWLTQAIVPYLGSPLTILEPACGECAIVNVLREAFPAAGVMAFDIAPPTGIDFLAEDPEPTYDLIITNPPYSLAQEFVERAKLWRASERSLIVMLLRVNFLGSQKRGKWLRVNTPSVYVSPRRPSFGTNKDGKPGTDATEYAWFIWGPGKPTLGILYTDENESFQFTEQRPEAAENIPRNGA